MLKLVCQNVTRNSLRNGVLALISLFFSLFSHAELPVRNLNPLTMVVGIPQLASAKKLTADQQLFSLNTTLSSHYIESNNNDDKLLFDGESTVTDLLWRRGFSHVEMELMIPYIRYEGGDLDNFIRDWHHTFHLPGGSRDLVKNNQFLLSYKGKNTALFNGHTEGVGDIRLTVGKQMQDETAYQSALQTLIKLPTGDSDSWLGSGGTDVSLFTTQAWQNGVWEKQLQLGFVLIGKSDILPDQSRRFAAFASTAINYAMRDDWFFTVQLDTQTPLYKHTHQEALGDSQMISVGSMWKTAKWRWHMALLEDIHVNSAPDVGFQLGLQFGN